MSAVTQEVNQALNVKNENNQLANFKNKILTSSPSWSFSQHKFNVSNPMGNCYDIFAPEFDVIVKAIKDLKTSADNFFKEAGEILGCSFALLTDRDFSNPNIAETTRGCAPSEIHKNVENFIINLRGIPFDTIRNDLVLLQSSLSESDKNDVQEFITTVWNNIEDFLKVVEKRFQDMTPLTLKAETPKPSAPPYTPMASRSSDTIGPNPNTSLKTTLKNT